MITFFIYSSHVAANHKTATESDVLNKIAGVLKYAPDGSRYGTTIQFCPNFPHKYTTVISTIKLASK